MADEASRKRALDAVDKSDDEEEEDDEMIGPMPAPLPKPKKKRGNLNIAARPDLCINGISFCSDFCIFHKHVHNKLNPNL